MANTFNPEYLDWKGKKTRALNNYSAREDKRAMNPFSVVETDRDAA